MVLLPHEPNDEEKREELPQDNGTPFRPAADASSVPLDDTHPQTDTNMQAEEQYEEGVRGAAEIPEPSPGIPHIADADQS